MTVTRVTQQNAEIYRQMSINNLEKRHEALRLEEQRIKLDLYNNEQKLVEMNRMMNRPGQNIDKMA